VDLFFYKDPEELKKEQEEEEQLQMGDYGAANMYDVPPQDGAFKLDTTQYEAPPMGAGEFGGFDGGFEAAPAPAGGVPGGFGDFIQQPAAGPPATTTAPGTPPVDGGFAGGDFGG